MSIDQTEIGQALDIAKRTRENILFGKGNFENHMHGFFTVAQILNRKEELEWIEGELRGQFDPVPNYRKNVFKRMKLRGVQIFEAMEDYNLSYEDCRMPVAKIIHELKSKERDRVPYKISDDEFKKLEKLRPDNEKKSFSCIIPNEDLENIFSSLKVELLRRLNIMISELTYGKIPRDIFKEFKDSVDKKLAKSNPEAITALNVAYESLGDSENPEKIAQVALACRRLIKHVADGLFPAKNERQKLSDGEEIEVTDDRVLNRLIAHIDSIKPKNLSYLAQEIELLRELLHGEGSVNQGIHDDISNSKARKLVLQTYVILGDIILAEDEKSTKT